MPTGTRFPHHNHLVKEKNIEINLNANVSNVYISSISYCMNMHKASLFSNVTETCSCKRPCPGPKIEENVYLFPELTESVHK